MRHYNKDAHPLAFATASTKTAVLAVLALAMAAILALLGNMVISADNIPIGGTIFLSLAKWLLVGGIGFFAMFFVLLVAALILTVRMSDAAMIRHMVRRSLFSSEYGNPLRLKDGERLPKVTCEELERGVFGLTITTISVTPEDLTGAMPSISAALNKKYHKYAVIWQDPDIAFNYVKFIIEDVTIDRSITAHDVSELMQSDPTKLIVQHGTHIDLTTSGSMLVAGKTRSGKTTGIISMLLQALLAGRDAFGSKIIIIDPKQAELSRLPHVVTLDKDGEATAILDAIKDFADTAVMRQQVLNDLSEQSGDAVKYFDAAADMKPSFLFIDEYVACRTLFPKKADKENPDYCLATFDGLIKRIVTMGASAGCFVIISIAEASVEEGGLPSMLKNAMSTKILFKPTLPEARLMWDSNKLETLNTGRVYNAGDAWFSSTDGIHDNVSYVHFPRMEFPVYRELGRLLEEYYKS